MSHALVLLRELLQDGLDGSGQSILLGLCFSQVLAQGGEVGLDLRLSAGGTHHDGSAIFQRVDQHVGGRLLHPDGI